MAGPRDGTTQTRAVGRRCMSARVLLSGSDLQVNRGERRVLRGFDFTLSEGEAVALVGVNGSGKTTLLETLAGLHRMNGGRVERHDAGEAEIVRDAEGQRGNIRGFGLCLQSDAICGDERVAERVRSACHVAQRGVDDGTLEAVLEEWGLAHRADDRVAKLSGGLRRRVAVLSALAPAALSDEPTCILLDEPSEGLDESSRGLLVGWLRALAGRGHGILIATHDPEMIAACDRVVTISDSGSLESEGQESIAASASLPESNGLVSHDEFFSWPFRLERRNPIDTIGRGVPALLALLLAFTLSTDIPRTSENYDLLAALILTPAFISAVVAPALLKRLTEERAGDWWRAMIGAPSRVWFSVFGASFILPLPVFALSWFVLVGDIEQILSSLDILLLVLIALTVLDMSAAATALHLMVGDLSRPSAAAGVLLLLVLVWPFLELSSALSSVMAGEGSAELALGSTLADIGIAWSSIVLIWAIAVIIPED